MKDLEEPYEGAKIPGEPQNNLEEHLNHLEEHLNHLEEHFEDVKQPGEGFKTLGGTHGKC